MKLQPVEIRREPGRGLVISWSDGSRSEITAEHLRQLCPCASCREQRGDGSHAAPLAPKKSSLLRVVEHSKSESCEIKEIWGVGNYAIGVQWGDGHNTGIYPFELLRSL